MGPLILWSLGLSGVGLSFLGKIAPYRFLFILLSIGLLGLAHYQMATKPMGKSTVIFIWIATMLAIIMHISPALLNIYFILFQ